MKVNHLKVIFKTVPLSFSASKRLFILDVLLSVVSGFFGVIIVFATTNLFNKVSLFAGGSNDAISVLAAALCFYFGIIFTKNIVDWISDYLSFIISEKSVIALSELLHKKANAIEPISFEDSKLLDYIDNAGRGI